MSTITDAVATEAALWGRVLEPADPGRSPEAARFLLRLRFPDEDVARMHELAAKARDGDLTTSERAELDIYEQVGHALSLMKSIARRALRATSSSSGQ